MAEVNPINQNVQPVSGVQPGIAQAPQKLGAESFHQVLTSKLKPALKFSGHAAERLQRRNIVLNQESMQKLNQAVEKAAAKGCRESLILMDSLALIVSVRNNTVITAIDGEHLKENVFTNIDSVVIV